MSAKTPADEQIEALKRLRSMPATPSKAPAPGQAPEPAPSPKPLEAVEAGPLPERRLTVNEERWQALKERQARTREFKTQQEAGDWAAELLLNLPPGSHRLDPAAKAALYALIDQWFTARSRT